MELRKITILLAFLVGGLFIACGSDSKSNQHTISLETDPASIMNQAVAQLLALRSASFSLNHLEGNTMLVPGVLMTKVYGEVSIPDRFNVTVEAEAEFLKSYLEINIITIEDSAYMTDILNGSWSQVSPERLPFNLSNLGQTLAAIVEAVEDTKILGQERLGNVETLHINGQIASEDLSGLVPGSGKGFPVELELWLDESHGLLQQVLIHGRVVPTDDKNTVRELRLKDINVPVVIKPPNEVS